MKSQVSILLFVLLMCVFTNGKQLPGDIGDNQDKWIHVVEDTHQSKYDGSERCPIAEDIAPCQCKLDVDDNAIDLFCSAVESEKQLMDIFKLHFPDKNFREFNLRSNKKLKVLESSVFNDVTFQRIYISYSALETVEQGALAPSYETATEIIFYNLKLTSFPFDELSQFSKLTDISLSMNSLNLIPAPAFDGLNSLEYLDLGYNTANIAGTFMNLPSLKEIYLYGNHLEMIKKGFIKPGSPNLEYIGLSYNDIMGIEHDSFDIVEGLVVDLDYNSLTTLGELTWRPLLEAHGELRVAFNQLQCGCDITWLFYDTHLMSHVAPYVTCSDGENIHELNKHRFDDC